MAAHTDWLAMFSPFLALSLDFCALLFPPESHRNIWTSNVFSGSFTDIGIDVRPDRYSYLGHLIPASNSTKFWNSFVFFFVTSFWSIQLFLLLLCLLLSFSASIAFDRISREKLRFRTGAAWVISVSGVPHTPSNGVQKKSHFMGMIFFIFRK